MTTKIEPALQQAENPEADRLADVRAEIDSLLRRACSLAVLQMPDAWESRHGDTFHDAVNVARALLLSEGVTQ